MTPHPLNPVALFVAGWDWRGCTNRAQYWAALAWFGVPQLIIVGIYQHHPWQSMGRIAGFGFVALTSFVLLGHTVRRLRDIGWHGGWATLSIIPGFGLIATLAFGLKAGGTPTRPGRSLVLGYALGLLLPALLVLRIFVVEPFWIPTGSMKPNLLLGDYVIALRTQNVQPGDIIVFKHPRTGDTFVKRLIAGPGDLVTFDGQRPVINGRPFAHRPMPDHSEALSRDPFNGLRPKCRSFADEGATCLKSQWLETAPDGRAYRILTTTPSPSSRFAERFTVPQGHVFVLGDNRDNSNDSRVPGQYGLGFVPEGNIAFRVEFALLNFLSLDRFFKGVE